MLRKATIINWGLNELTVSVPESWTHEQIIAWAASQNPGAWRIVEFGEKKDNILTIQLERVE